MVTTSFIWRYVDPDRPARTVIRTALTDWRGAGGGRVRRGAAPAPARGPPGHGAGEDPVTQTEPRRRRRADGLDPDFADYYDDAPPRRPRRSCARPRRSSGVAGRCGAAAPAAGPPAAPAAPADVDSPFLGLFPGRPGPTARAGPPAAPPPPSPQPDRSRRRPPAPAGTARPPASRHRPAHSRTGRRRRSEPVRAGPTVPPYKDRDAVAELAITEIAGHLTFTQTMVTAWYWLPEVRWAFRPDADREALHRRHLRAVRRPGRVPAAPAPHHPAVRGRRVGPHASTTTPPARCPTSPARRPGATTSSAPSGTCSRSTTPRARRTSASPSPGGPWATRSPSASAACSGAGPATPSASGGPRTVEQFDEVLGAFGMRGRRVTAAELEWLLFRSVALGMAPPTVLSGVDRRRVGHGRPARPDRTDRAVPVPVRLDDPAGQPAHRRGAARRRADRRPDGAAGDPRAARAVAALPRAAAVADGDLVPGRRARPRRLVPQPRAPAADDPVAAARLRRARHGRATRAGAAGPAGPGARRRDDHRPAGRLVPGARLAPPRRLRRHPRGVPRAGPPGHPALPAGAAGLAAAPQGPGCAGPRVHPGRAAGQHRLPAPDAGQAARRRAAAGGVHCGRSARRPHRAHRRHLPPPGLPRPALPDGGPRALRPRPCSSPSPAVASRHCSARWATWPPDAACRSRCSTRPARWPGCARCPSCGRSRGCSTSPAPSRAPWPRTR